MSRVSIEAQVYAARIELARLEAKLAATQPDVLTIVSDARTGNVTVGLSDREIRVAAGRTDRGRRPEYVGYFAPGELRDWLNYHFPKENA